MPPNDTVIPISPGSQRSAVPSPTVVGWLGVIALALLFLTLSWRKWPDTFIDFGNQLYVPWRLSEGDVLYRDVGHYYGPLSQYFNGLLFKLFGPGMMVLVTANLVIFAFILITIGKLFRTAWGTGASLLAGALFVTVFGFAQHTGIGNYNYATPYAHESTHGLLICMFLIVLLLRWTSMPTRALDFWAGFVLGLTAVLKPEFMLAGLIVSLVAGAVRWRFFSRPDISSIAVFAIAAFLPTLLFFGWFCISVPIADAALAATRAWSVIITSPEISQNIAQSRFLGFDHPWANLQTHALAIGFALLILAGAIGAVWLALRLSATLPRLLCLAILALGIGYVSYTQVAWLQSGRCLLGLVGLYFLFKVIQLARRKSDESPAPHEIAQLLLVALALALLVRMGLNGRIFHLGFYQAALAALIIPSIALGEIPYWLKLKANRWAVGLSILALVLPGAVVLTLHSQSILRLKNEPIGEGADRYLTYSPEVNPMGRIFAMTSEFIRAQPPDQSVLVLPQGVMLNYLSRHPSAATPLLFFSFGTSEFGEAHWVEELEKHPPAWVVLLSNDLTEYGINRYGDESGSGKELLTWVHQHYKIGRAAGGDPLDLRQRGVVIYQRN